MGMARPLRLEVAGYWYHVTGRGNARGRIFLNDGDRRRFVELLGEIEDRLRFGNPLSCSDFEALSPSASDEERERLSAGMREQATLEVVNGLSSPNSGPVQGGAASTYFGHTFRPFASPRNQN